MESCISFKLHEFFSPLQSSGCYILHMYSSFLTISSVHPLIQAGETSRVTDGGPVLEAESTAAAGPFALVHHLKSCQQVKMTIARGRYFFFPPPSVQWEEVEQHHLSSFPPAGKVFAEEETTEKLNDRIHEYQFSHRAPAGWKSRPS